MIDQRLNWRCTVAAIYGNSSFLRSVLRFSGCKVWYKNTCSHNSPATIWCTWFIVEMSTVKYSVLEVEVYIVYLNDMQNLRSTKIFVLSFGRLNTECDAERARHRSTEMPIAKSRSEDWTFSAGRSTEKAPTAHLVSSFFNTRKQFFLCTSSTHRKFDREISQRRLLIFFDTTQDSKSLRRLTLFVRCWIRANRFSSISTIYCILEKKRRSF